jgi:hypothetical protein
MQVRITLSNGGESRLLCLDHISPGATVVIAGMTVGISRSCEGLTLRLHRL